MDPTLIAVALVPTALLIGLGAWLRHRGTLGDPFWAGAESLTYTVLLPALFLRTLATADFSGAQVAAMAAVIASATGLVAAGCLVARRALAADGPAFTSVFQGSVRFNNYVGLVIAQTLFGAPGIALAALANAVLVPLVNVLATVVLARHGHARIEGAAVVRAIATNPLVVSCVAGAALNVVGRALGGWLTLPVVAGPLAVLSATLGIVGQAALPLGVLCVGSGLRRPELGTQLRPIVGSSLLKLAVLPALGYLLARLAGLTGPSGTVGLVFLALPVASSAYVLARKLGGDAELMASITAVQTVLALATLPVWMVVASGL